MQNYWGGGAAAPPAPPPGGYGHGIAGWHRKGVGSIPARGPIVDEFFSTVPVGFSTCV